MTSLFINDRNPFPKSEIMTKSFLIDKIASNLRMKYKKVFSLINYDENSLKTDIHFLLSKYISNKHKEINIKYIETTILNKIRDKYKYRKFKSPTQNKNKNLIRIVDSSPNKYQSYLDLIKHKTNSNEKNIKLPAITNNPVAKSTEINGPIINNNYPTLEENKDNNNIVNNIKNSNNNEEESIYNINSKNKVNNINNEINEINNKTDELKNDEGSIKKELEMEQEELNQLEKYRENIKNQIDEMNKEIEREKALYLKNETNNRYNNYQNENDQLDENNNYNSYNNNINSYNSKLKNGNNWSYPSITLEQMQYLERKKRIEEDYQNKQNRYIFVKPKHYKNEEEELNSRNNSSDNSNSFKYDNVRINKYSMDKINEFNKIKEKIKQEKELRYKNNKSTSNIMHDFDEFRPREIEKNIPYEDKIQMKILKRSLEQEKAIEHLKKLLYPERQLLAEREYQGFNKAIKERNLMKKREIELADKARRIQIEKMKKSLDYNIDSKKRRKNEEKKIEQKYREMIDKDYELFLEKERKEKYEKAKKMEIYRNMLDEQIEQKNQLMMEENNLSERDEDFYLVEN